MKMLDAKLISISNKPVSVHESLTSAAIEDACLPLMSANDIIIEKFNETSHESYAVDHTDGHVSFFRTTHVDVTGRVSDCEPVSVIAKFSVITVYADKLSRHDVPLAGLFKSHDVLAQHVDVLFNADTGQFADTLETLSESCDLYTYGHDNIVIVSDLQVVPDLVGGHFERKVLSQYFNRYKSRSGLACIPVEPFGSEAQGEYVDCCAISIMTELSKDGFETHPYAPRYMVGDLDVVFDLSQTGDTQYH